MEISEILKRVKDIQAQKSVLKQNILEELDYLKEKGVIIDININNSSIASVNRQENKEEYLRLKDRLADKSFLESIQSQIEKIPTSNGTKYFSKINVNIGIICDEFLYNSFKDIANFYYVNKDKYKDLSGKIDVLIVASTWKGLFNDWKGLANPKNSKVRGELKEVIEFFRNQDVKIVYYSKEDPTNYHLFIDIAKHCDYIFTTCSEKLQEYREECNNDQVFTLEFGVNPIYNNPIGLNVNKKYNAAIFAGSWYEKYPNRKKDSKILFNGVLNSGNDLKIIDRNFNKNLKNHFFPSKYLSHISPSIDHSTLQKVFKLYPWAINLNSVQTSESMFANRVYELQAMGSLILSNYSIGVNNLFPNIFIIQNEDEVKYIMNNVSDKEIKSHQMYGIRKVLNNHTTYHRIDKLLNLIGYTNNYTPIKKVAIVVDDKSNSQNTINYERQIYKHCSLMDFDEFLETYRFYDYVTFFNSEYDYGEFYLDDMVNGFKYTNSSFITKDSYYKGSQLVNGIEHNYVNKVKDKYKTLFDIRDYDVEYLLDLEGSVILENGYSIDSLELNEKPLNFVNNKELLKLSVIIPVYNNGDHLYGKCFMSLLRSSLFKNMEIILVDDGSTDINTINIVNRLSRLYSNVKTYMFNDGGSGSASRPRNKGLELASAPFITYLDPDNEAVNDGYYHLYNELQKDNELDLVVGDIIKFDVTQKELNYSKNAFAWNEDGVIQDTYNFLKYSNMRAQSIQALIVKKEIITKNNLKMVEKAAGQDTLFFQQLVLACKKIKAVNSIIHIYYAAVSNSVTNSITKRFFEKYLILEKERNNFLKSQQLLDVYVNRRFQSYFIGWYLTRVVKIKESDIQESLITLEKIYSLYKYLIRDKKDIIKVFEKYVSRKKYKEFVEYSKKYFNT